MRSLESDNPIWLVITMLLACVAYSSNIGEDFSVPPTEVSENNKIPVEVEQQIYSRFSPRSSVRFPTLHTYPPREPKLHSIPHQRSRSESFIQLLAQNSASEEISKFHNSIWKLMLRVLQDIAGLNLERDNKILASYVEYIFTDVAKETNALCFTLTKLWTDVLNSTVWDFKLIWFFLDIIFKSFILLLHRAAKEKSMRYFQ